MQSSTLLSNFSLFLSIGKTPRSSYHINKQIFNLTFHEVDLDPVLSSVYESLTNLRKDEKSNPVQNIVLKETKSQLLFILKVGRF